MSRNKDKYDSANRRQQIFLSQEDIAAGKKTNWSGLEITGGYHTLNPEKYHINSTIHLFTGCVRNISPSLWEFEHLTALYLNDNQLLRLPADVGMLTSLRTLDLSSNKLRSLPAELGELIQLR